MTTSIDRLLADVKTTAGCQLVSGDVLPLPPSSLPDANALVVNCFFSPDMLMGCSKELLEQCRAYAGKVLRSISNFIRDEDIEFDTIGVSIFQKDELESNIRVYWANSRKSLLRNAAQQITSEGSHIDEISDLLAGYA
jgi:hypothetical protein